MAFDKPPKPNNSGDPLSEGELIRRAWKDVEISERNETGGETPKDLSDQEEEIRSAKDFEALREIILKSEGLIGKSKVYTPERLIQIIDGVRNGELTVTSVSRSGGLRDKVIELLEGSAKEEVREEGNIEALNFSVSRAKNFEQLFEALDSFRGTLGTKNQPPEDVKESISELLALSRKVTQSSYLFKAATNRITRTAGIRDKVVELLG